MAASMGIDGTVLNAVQDKCKQVMNNLENLAFELAVLSNDDLLKLSEIMNQSYATRAEALEMAMRTNHIKKENDRLNS